jgi:hypothetical protein
MWLRLNVAMLKQDEQCFILCYSLTHNPCVPAMCGRVLNEFALLLAVTSLLDMNNPLASQLLGTLNHGLQYHTGYHFTEFSEEFALQYQQIYIIFILCSWRKSVESIKKKKHTSLQLILARYTQIVSRFIVFPHAKKNWTNVILWMTPKPLTSSLRIECSFVVLRSTQTLVATFLEEENLCVMNWL